MKREKTGGQTLADGTNPKVDAYLAELSKWRDEVTELRRIVLDCALTEDLKWGVPCYAHQNANIVLIHVFKEYCALLFFKGALLKDPNGILVQQTANVQASRQIRFPGVQAIKDMESVLKDYVRKAIDVEKSGLDVEFKQTTEFAVPEEFRHVLNEDPAIKTAFETLTAGRQRAYLLHFAAPKQSKTRESRIEKCIPQIIKGKGLDDR